jgi:hypothetical protein
VAVIVIVVGVRTNGGVYVTEQLPADSVHEVGEKVPPPLDENVTVPVGTIGVPDPMSFTVTVHVVVPKRGMVEGLQVMVTDTGLGATVTVVECEPPPWDESPE